MLETRRCEKPEDARNRKMQENLKMRETRRCEKPEDAKNLKMLKTRRCEKPEDVRLSDHRWINMLWHKGPLDPVPVTDAKSGLPQIPLSNESSLDSSVWHQVICSSSSFLDHPSWTPGLVTQASDVLVIHLNKITESLDALLHNLICCFHRQQKHVMTTVFNIHLSCSRLHKCLGKCLELVVVIDLATEWSCCRTATASLNSCSVLEN